MGNNKCNSYNRTIVNNRKETGKRQERDRKETDRQEARCKGLID